MIVSSTAVFCLLYDVDLRLKRALQKEVRKATPPNRLAHSNRRSPLQSLIAPACMHIQVI
jgi:hypothetical protein